MKYVCASFEMYLIIADRCFSLAVVKIEHVVIVVIALNAAKSM